MTGVGDGIQREEPARWPSRSEHRRMHRAWRLVTGPACCALLIVEAATGVHAGTPRALRYRFVAGQTLNYQVTVSGKQSVTSRGAIVEALTWSLRFRARYHFFYLDAQGNARLSITADRQDEVETRNGRSRHRVPNPATFLPASSDCGQFIDGTRYCAGRGTYGWDGAGGLPASPTTVGARWVSHIDYDYGLPSNVRLALVNTLQRIDPAPDGVAQIAIAGSLQGPSTYDSQGEHYALLLRLGLQGDWRFDVGRGTFLGERLVATADGAGTAVDDRGGQLPVALHTRWITTMQLLKGG